MSTSKTSNDSSSNQSSVLYRRTKAARRSERRRISEEGLGVWTKVEHERFLEGKRLYPSGPWKLVAEFVGTRNTRQTMTHAQKYRQKLERRQRGLRTTRKISADEQMLQSPELYYTSSPRAIRGSPKSVDMALSTISVVDVGTVADTAELPTPTATATKASAAAAAVHFGGFEQLLMDNTVYLDAVDSFEHTDAELVSYAAEQPLKMMDAGSPTHHADADLPWLDECLDFFIQTCHE